MSDRPRDFDGEDEQTRDLAPENDNSEQDDAASQANTVADEAAARGTDVLGLSDSEKVKGGIGDEDDEQDLVDHMKQMVTSGRIDMSAYRGEPDLDDEENGFDPDEAEGELDLPAGEDDVPV